LQYVYDLSAKTLYFRFGLEAGSQMK
jgi:hypothetical protein